jgi:hypothetical protein
MRQATKIKFLFPFFIALSLLSFYPQKAIDERECNVYIRLIE